MAVTANQIVTRQEGCRLSYPAAVATVYEGSLVFVNADGYADDDTASGANQFGGVAIEKVDNSSGSAGDLNVECWAEGVFELSGSGFAQADLGQAIYATDNYTISTQPGTAGVLIGEVVEYVSATVVRVKISVLAGGVAPGGVQNVTPNSGAEAASLIQPGVTKVAVGAVTNDANDFIVLPALAEVPVGHTINIACNAGGNFELRTPAASGEKINTVDCDGTQEYLCTDTELVRITKVSDTDGWVASALTALGAVATAVVPD